MVTISIKTKEKRQIADCNDHDNRASHDTLEAVAKIILLKKADRIWSSE